VVIASELLARDLLQRGVLSAPFSNALPGARYYLVTTEAAAQRADIIALREWLVGQMASGDGAIRRRIAGLPAANVGLFIGLVAANDIDQILHRISRGERVAQRRQRGKGFINRDAVIIIGDRQHKLPSSLSSGRSLSRSLTASTACCGIYNTIGLRNIFPASGEAAIL
jgi:hypothetical protein